MSKTSTVRIRIYVALAIGIIAFMVAVWFLLKSLGMFSTTPDAIVVDSTQIKVENPAQSQQMVITNIEKKDSVAPLKVTNIITENSVGGIVELGTSIQVVNQRLKNLGYDIKSVQVGDGDNDYSYVASKDGKNIFTITSDSKGYVSDIIVFSPEYHTSSGIKVGMSFPDFFKKHPKADMRYGDMYDCVTPESATEMCKAEGLIFMHHVELGSKMMMADYDFDKMSFRLKSPIPPAKIEGIVVSYAIWK